MGKTLSENSTPHLSILIPTKDNENDLLECLNSILNLDYDFAKLEIVIWDNCSQSAGKKRIKEYLSRMTSGKSLKAKFLESNDNYGVYTSRDQLFKMVCSDARFVLSIDDDVILPPQLLQETLPFFELDNSIGILGPRTVYDDKPSETAHGAGFINWWLGHYSTKDARETLECDYVIGCCMLIKRRLIEEIGGFDHDYYTSHGEVDFCLRAKKKGYKVLYHPGISVRHRVDRGGTKTFERTYYVYRNKLFVIKKNAPLPQKCVALALYSLLWLPKGILDSIIRNRGVNSQEIKTILRGMMDGWLGRGGKRAKDFLVL
jgi:GT2 family glycosyltransferase